MAYTKYFTVKSTSAEGEWYLVNGWNRWKAFWMQKDNCNPDTCFKREADAKRSLTKLLKVMPDYREDEFEMVSVQYNDKGYCFEVKPMYPL